MKREVKKYLFDIKTSIESINSYLGETRNFFEYQNNKLLRRGIERELEIIGEAMSKLLKIAPDLQIENARQIVDTRNCGSFMAMTKWMTLLFGVSYRIICQN